MAQKIAIGQLKVHIVAEALTHEAFAPFGDAVYNPRPEVHPSAAAAAAAASSTQTHAAHSILPSNASSANQRSAIKYSNVSRLRNLYDQAPSRRGEAIMSIFSCATHAASEPGHDITVRYLERHPFTTQTFTPIKSSASSYLVIVAPSLPPGPADAGLPVPSGDDLPGRGLPNLKALRAFIATSSQAVTYGAGTWHAPMIALGKPGAVLDFVVSQFASGEAMEDCQLLEFVSGDSSPQEALSSLTVQVPHGPISSML